MFTATAVSLVMPRPSEDQADHGPLCAAVCQICHSALSVPRAKTSSRPSVFTATAGSLVTLPPTEDQADHGPPMRRGLPYVPQRVVGAADKHFKPSVGFHRNRRLAGDATGE